jgi:hypothetical protein
MNLGSIRSHFKAVLNRSDTTDALADTFIEQGIARVQRSLRIPSMEKQFNYTITSQTGAVLLPDDFLEGIDLFYDNHALTRIPMNEFQDRKRTGEVGQPHFFTREQGSYLITPEPSSGTVTINYYANFVAMTADTDENILAQVASDLIIYSALTYAADFYLDERAQTFEARYIQFMTELQEQANDSEMAGSLQSIRPTYTY